MDPMLIFKTKFLIFFFFLIFLFLLFCSFFNNFFLLKDGETALYLAADKGFEQIVKILVEHGSNLDLQINVFDFFFFDFDYSLFFLIFICCCGLIVDLFHVVIVNGCVV